tara:strand:- start:18289 stop:22917 length:4629 start_codon:yes stop_codon:yes gene_type:complete
VANPVKTEPALPFHPLIAKWFQQRYGSPTEIQSLSWPQIMAGSHVLISAPTGSGKTLTAFLSALNALASGEVSTGGLRILYISPLKALNNDIRRNLITPLEELKSHFESAGETFPDVRVSVRSGDTPDDERRSMMRHPPEILITTPESLNILLTSSNGRRIFEGLNTVILDEIHSVAPTKRGVHLMTAVERLELLCPGFQRIALSATVRPMERVARFVGGYERLVSGSEVIYRPRPVEVLETSVRKEYALEVDFPVVEHGSRELETASKSEWPEDVLFGSIVQRLKEIIKSNRSTLIFTNSRRMAEKISMLINEGEDQILSYCHHGALSREIRSVVEQDLKEGRLPAVVATASLELGIDIGDLDQVVLIQSPGFLSTTLQRLGRAGHSVGAISRGLFLPLHGRDLLQSAILAGSVEAREIEEVQPIRGALDILSQIILSMLCSEEWNPDELLSFLRSSYSYHELPENQFRTVLEMLSGRFATSRIRELRPRIHRDPIKNTLKAAKGAPFLLYMNGGTIPDRGYYGLRHLDTKSRIGELDEEFVWERSIGDTFTLGNQSWRIMEINHNDVLVRPAPADAASMAPFWRADAQDRDAFVSEKLALFLEEKSRELESDFSEELVNKYHLSPGAAGYLQEFLRLQKERTGQLPHRHHLLIEHYEDPMNRSDRKMVILHTLWGGQVNRPFALAIRGAFLKESGLKIQTMSDDDCVMVMLPTEFDQAQLLDIVRADNLESLLKEVLSSTGFFGALFRQSAGIAMLLPGKIRNRTPLWLNRLRSKKLLEATSSFQDFPVTLETWRASLTDTFDLKTLHQRLSEIHQGQIRISEAFTRSPSPFARNLIWQQTNTFMYQDDRSDASGRRPAEDFFKELARTSGLRPSIPDAVLELYRSRMQRTAPGYPPEGASELLALIRDRILISQDEYRFYISHRSLSQGENPRTDNNTGTNPEPLQDTALYLVSVLNGEHSWICALENVPLLESIHPSEETEILSVEGGAPSRATESALERIRQENARQAARDGAPEPEDILQELIQSYLPFTGPISRSELYTAFYDFNAVDRVLERLLEDGRIVEGPLLESSAQKGSLEICDTETLEILLRLTRQHFRPDFKPHTADELPLFLAEFQGLVRPGSDLDELQLRMDQLIGYPLKAGLWETEILPARMNPYFPAWMDSLFELGLLWMGTARQSIAFLTERDLPLFLDSRTIPDGKIEAGLDSIANRGEAEAWLESDSQQKEASGTLESESMLDTLFPHRKGRFNFYDLLSESGQTAQELTTNLWELSWQGFLTNDSMTSLRKGIDNNFQAPAAQSSSGGRTGRARWSGALSSAGNWRLIPWKDYQNAEISILEQEEINREKIQLLLGRYGILFRDLLQREFPGFRWKSLVSTLRRMELSGEVMGGFFFQGIQSLQFMSPQAFRKLSEGLSEDSLYWMNALDPVSLCGVDVEGLNLPRRIAGNHLVFHGKKLVLLSRRRGKDIDILVPAGSADLKRYLEFFSQWLARPRNAPSRIDVETINGLSALHSEYRKELEAFGFISGHRTLTLHRKY